MPVPTPEDFLTGEAKRKREFSRNIGEDWNIRQIGNDLVGTYKPTGANHILAVPGAWTSFVPTVSWTGAGTPSGFFTRIGRTAFANYRWTLTGAPAGGALSISLPVAARQGDMPIGTYRGGTFTFDQNGFCRTEGGAVSFVIEDDVGTILTSAVAGLGAGDIIFASVMFETLT